ncbi:hypothetical protein CPS_1063 [Colwellia psychrerythraea 34H]|uniref:Uncharacterized protein n=1 Tax=Colwellia psychrerythraea (strain 34H / ATCC BAA-681) TaxID=167879 RepID=Q487F8_COLP3|nr:hypothetical protein CPS_1063 [Colwellia psychrerythraea 34H]
MPMLKQLFGITYLQVAQAVTLSMEKKYYVLNCFK